DLKNKENGWKVYAADFVTTEDGTGIVHIAPAFGEDDLNLGNKEKLPFIQHVGMDGKIKSEVKDFAGMKAKPIENPQATDIEVLKFLSAQGTIFAKEKFTHSYPHCYRCDTPLLNYATSSWFVEVTKFRHKLAEANANVKWVPREIGEGRFGKLLESAPDWAISRSRFWGASMPVWRCDDCKKIDVLGSIEDIKRRTARGNTFLAIRHGEAENNTLHVESSNPKTPHHLTANGREHATMTAQKLAKEKIDVIYCSEFMRAKETADIIAEKIGFPKDEIVYDKRINEINVGALDGKPEAEYEAFFKNRKEKFTKAAAGGETDTDVKKRMSEFLYDVDAKYSGKKILIVSHNTAIWLMFAGAWGLTVDQAIAIRPKHDFIENSEVKVLPFSPIPHNRDYELDLHRPFIDEIAFPCTCGGTMKRIPEVFDCWFESGSMPYGEMHYPFENNSIFNPEKDLRFPADFIAEGIDQTRGWFYSMLVVATVLFGESPYRHVMVNGTVLAEDGLKMSKKLKNYTDPVLLADKYSADAMRYYLLSSPAVKAEDLKFSDKGVDDVLKKVSMRIGNVHSFFEMYGGFDAKEGKASGNVLDRWIIARLKETATHITEATERYELDRATRPVADFVDDLSTWYLRRSRERFKSEDPDDRYGAMRTTRTVILEFSKLIAPVMPFLAEDLYLKITGSLGKESVHLAEWPEHLLENMSEDEVDVLERMKAARAAVSVGLEARAKAKVKVRQPLARLTLKSRTLEGKSEYIDLIKDEVNVKDVVFNDTIAPDAELDLDITPELRDEGTVRDIIRAVQELRKEKGLKPGEPMTLAVETDAEGKKLFDRFAEEIKAATSAEKALFEAVESAEPLDFDGTSYKLAIK
ncbi:class I tRNA ligase family protein, partial [Patescibacteria group bacterium]|nr:class I tRNA ligase family protein [Patescibacteria group bacterium]